MKRNTTQLVIIIALIACTVTLLTCGVFVACKNMREDKPTTPAHSMEDDDNWTDNY